MAKKNIDDLQITDTPEGVRITVKNFSPDLLLQHSVGLLFLSALTISGFSFSWPMPLVLPILLLNLFLIYRTVYNIKDHYLLTISGNELVIIKGMHHSKIIDLRLDQIQNVYIKRRTGKVLRSAKMGGATTVTPDMNELIIVTAGREYFVSDEMEYRVQATIRTKILEQMEKNKQ